MQAQSNKGTLVTLARRTNAEIKQFKRQKVPFFCPVCKEQVIIKAGTKMIPHFAHQTIGECPSHEGGEGVYHEQGKLLLYQWLNNHGLNVVLEAYIPEINQRPDLLLKLNGRHIAIEYQCARISATIISQRNAGYKKVGIIPIWILGATHLQRQSQYHIKINHFISHFIHQFSHESSTTLFFFCPQKVQLTTVQDLIFTKTGQTIGQINAARLQQMHFTDMFRQQLFSKKEVYQLWGKEKRQFRLKQRKRLYGRELAWHQWLYVNGTHLEHLPSIIHLPVAAQYRMKTPTWDWQSRLCLTLLDPLPIGTSTTVQACKQLLKQHQHHRSEFPLIASSDDPIEQYLHYLVHLEIIHQPSLDTIQKIKAIHFHQNIEESLNEDEKLMNQLDIQVKQNTSMFHR